MRHFGIIGNPVKQSFSAKFFAEKFSREGIDAEYSLYPLDKIEDAPALMKQLDGLNVTIPYKQAVMPYLDRLDDTAREIGAVNVVKCEKQGDKHILTGYNTDCIGFMDTIRPHLKEHHTSALVLGTGGAAKAVYYGLKQLGIEPIYVSRTKNLTYNQLTEDIVREHKVIVNCTPLGMWPQTDSCADIPYSAIIDKHLLFDCVYNPEKTEFLRRGEEHGAEIVNGLGMLYGQAEAAWKIWDY